MKMGRTIWSRAGRKPKRTLAALTATAALAMVLAAPPAAAVTVTVTDLSGAQEPQDLANALVGTGVSINNVAYSGTDQSAGSFTNGVSTVGFADGIILSSGSATAVVGPNDSDNTSNTLGTPGDPDLDALEPGTLDATVLEFDVTPDEDTLFFNYVFGSEEYNEFVNSSFNDVFGFFVTRAGESMKTNCAVVDGSTPVSINTINNGNPFGTEPNSNPELYRNNDPNDPAATIDLEPDGLTVILQCAASVVPDQANHLKLAIADRGDSGLDSWVFLQAGSLSTTEEICDNGVDDDGDGLIDGADPDCPSGNTPPTVDAGGPYSGDEDTAIALDGTVTDPDSGDEVTVTWSVPEGTPCTFADPGAEDTTITCTEPGTYTATLTADDGVNEPVSDTATVTVGGGGGGDDDMVTGFVPPGGTIATGVGPPTPDNPTVSSFTLPNSGPGANITLTEAYGDPICIRGPCVGQVVTLSDFDGYQDFFNPPVLTITWDKTDAGRGDNSAIFVQKEDGSISRVLRCRVSRTSPCILSLKRVVNGDLRLRLLVLSGDPKFGKR